MASAYLILIFVLLTASQTQEQTASCPLASCSLVNQVNICTNGTSGVCSSSCITALVSNTVEECCNKVVESLTNVPTNGGQTCGEGSASGESLSLVNNHTPLAVEIHAGTYIVPQADFAYGCSGCIKSIQLAVGATSEVRDAERIKFHTFANRTENKSIVQRMKDVTVWNPTINATKSDRKVVEYRPSTGSAEVCFSPGDIFGFTIEAGSGITLLTRTISDLDDVVLNATNTLPMSILGCPQLNDTSLYTTGTRTDVTPLIHIMKGPPAPVAISTTTELTTTQSTTPATTRATKESPPTSNPPSSNPTVQTRDISAQSPGVVIYVAAGFGGAIYILLIVVIIVVVICIVQRRKHSSRNAQHGNNHNPFSVSVNDNEAYGVSNPISGTYHLDSNEAYGISSHIGPGDCMDSSEAYGVSIHTGPDDHTDGNEAYGIQLQQTIEQEFEEGAPHMYDYPMVNINHIEVKANEAYATAVGHQ